jgi:WD40 repeat protein
MTPASRSWVEEALKLWDVATGREIRTFPVDTGYVTSVAFSPDGRKVVSCSGGEVKVWNVN